MVVSLAETSGKPSSSLGDMVGISAPGRKNEATLAPGSRLDAEPQPLQQQLKLLAALLLVSADPHGYGGLGVEERNNAGQ
jgi:hypothetical protein